MIKALLILFIAAQVEASVSSSSSTLLISVTMPVVLQASTTRTTDLIYTIHEISNSREGYTVTLETDASGAKYNGTPVAMVDGKAVLTQVSSQDKSVDTFKGLVLNSKPSFLRVSIYANQ